MQIEVTYNVEADPEGHGADITCNMQMVYGAYNDTYTSKIIVTDTKDLARLVTSESWSAVNDLVDYVINEYFAVDNYNIKISRAWVMTACNEVAKIIKEQKANKK